MVTIYVSAFGLLGVLGLACIIGAIVFIKNFGIRDIDNAIAACLFGLMGLSLVIFTPMCVWYGLTQEVDIHMQNSEGKVIERTVKVFEYLRDGNCFKFYDDENHYCGWEVHYNYKD